MSRMARAASDSKSADSTTLVEFQGSLFGHSLMVPISNGSFAFGTWQGIYLCAWGDAREVEVCGGVWSLCGGVWNVLGGNTIGGRVLKRVHCKAMNM